MLIFVSIAIAGFLIVGGSFAFGHDHDAGHDGDAGHGELGAGEPTISVFSVKVIATLLMGFGAAGAIATHYGASSITASLYGILCGVILGGLMYFVLHLFYGQQSTSVVSSTGAVGCIANVTVSIGEGSPGEVALQLEGQYRNILARSRDGKPIPKGETVKIVQCIGGQVVVEPEKPALSATT